MNHLAHVQLSGTSPSIIVGNLAADYLRKRECLELPLSLQAGVRLHRFIDFTTDNDRGVRAAWALLRERHGKYASVIFDIYGDYLLATRWQHFEAEPIQVLTERAYEALRQNLSHLPAELADRFERMIEHDWLRQYGSYEGQAYVFERFGRRLSKPALLDGVIDTLRQHEQVLAKAFVDFYPKLQADCATLLQRIEQERKAEER